MKWVTDAMTDATFSPESLHVRRGGRLDVSSRFLSELPKSESEYRLGELWGYIFLD